MSSKIIHISCFEQILNEIDGDTLILFDIDQTLIDSTLIVGGLSWGQYMKQWIDSNMPNSQLYGLITYWIAHQVTVKAVERSIPTIVKDLQSHHVVLGLTARGETNWNYASVPNVDRLTDEQLRSVDICLSHPTNLDGVPGVLNGVIYTSQNPKGPFLRKILERIPAPKKIVFVDDNIQHLRSVAEALSDTDDTVFIGCHYTHSENAAAPLDPAVGLVQLAKLLIDDSIPDVQISLASLLQYFQMHIAPIFQRSSRA